MRPLALLALLTAAAPASAASAYRVSLPADAAITAAAVLLTGAAYAFSAELIAPRCPCDPAEVPAFDRWVIGQHSLAASRVSDVTVVLATLGPVALGWRDAGGARARLEDTVVLGETLALTGALTTLAKYTVQRPLPRAYEGDPTLVDSPGGYRPFFSGHTALAAAGLSVWAMSRRQRHGAEAWPWVAVGLVTASVAAERLAAGSHFPTDVLVAGALGTAIGILVPYLHRRSSPSAAAAPAAPVTLAVELPF